LEPAPPALRRTPLPLPLLVQPRWPIFASRFSTQMWEASPSVPAPVLLLPLPFLVQVPQVPRRAVAELTWESNTLQPLSLAVPVFPVPFWNSNDSSFIFC